MSCLLRANPSVYLFYVKVYKDRNELNGCFKNSHPCWLFRTVWQCWEVGRLSRSSKGWRFLLLSPNDKITYQLRHMHRWLWLFQAEKRANNILLSYIAFNMRIILHLLKICSLFNLYLIFFKYLFILSLIYYPMEVFICVRFDHGLTGKRLPVSLRCSSARPA